MDQPQLEYSFKFNFEENFDIYQTFERTTLSFTPLVVAVLAAYILLIVYGEKWMANREPFNLTKTLVLWNASMGVISGMAILRTYPRISYNFAKFGFKGAICNNE